MPLGRPAATICNPEQFHVDYFNNSGRNVGCFQQLWQPFSLKVATRHNSTSGINERVFTHPDNPLAFLVGFTALSSHLQLKTADWTTEREIIRTPWFRGLRLGQRRFRLSSGYQAKAAPESLETTVFTLSMV